jgi:hypothetical protein
MNPKMGVATTEQRDITKKATAIIFTYTTHCNPHCKEIRIYIFPEEELHGLSPNFHIHVSVSDLYIPTFGSLFSWSRIGRPIRGIYKSLTET